MTNGYGVAVLNISGLGAGVYNVNASFSGDDNYNSSTNNTTFNVAKMNTNLSIVKTVNNTNPFVGDLVNYTIHVTNNGVGSVVSIKVNDTLPDSLEFINSSIKNSGGDSIPYLWNIPLLNNGETATLNITCKVKSAGSIVNYVSIVINNYNNNGTIESSANITAVNPNSGGGNGTNGSDTGDGEGLGFDSSDRDDSWLLGDSLAKAGFPLILLVLLSVLSVYYWRRK